MFDDSNITTPEQEQDVTLKEGQQKVFVEPFAIRATNHNGNFILESHRASSPGDEGYIRLRDESGRLIASFMNTYVMDFYLFGQVDRQASPVFMDPAASVVAHANPIFAQDHTHSIADRGVAAAPTLEVATFKTNTGHGLGGAEIHGSMVEKTKSVEAPTVALTLGNGSPLEKPATDGSARDGEEGFSLNTKADVKPQGDTTITQPSALSILNKVFNIARNEIYKFFDEFSDGGIDNEAEPAPQQVDDSHAENESVAGVLESQQTTSLDVRKEESRIESSGVVEDHTAALDASKTELALDTNYTAAKVIPSTPQSRSANNGASFVAAVSGVASMEALEEAAWFTGLVKEGAAEQTPKTISKPDATSGGQPEHTEEVAFNASPAARDEEVKSLTMAGLGQDAEVRTHSDNVASDVIEKVSWKVQPPQEAVVRMPATVETVDMESGNVVPAMHNNRTSEAGIVHNMSDTDSSETTLEKALETEELASSMQKTEKEVATASQGTDAVTTVHTMTTPDLSAAVEQEDVEDIRTKDSGVETYTAAEVPVILSSEQHLQKATKASEIPEAAAIEKDFAEVARDSVDVEKLAHDMPAPDLSVAVESAVLQAEESVVPQTKGLVLSEDESLTVHKVEEETIQHIPTLELAIKPEQERALSEALETIIAESAGERAIITQDTGRHGDSSTVSEQEQTQADEDADRELSATTTPHQNSSEVVEPVSA